MALPAKQNPCARCGAENQPGVRYCIGCGNELNVAQPIAAPAVTPIPVAVAPRVEAPQPVAPAAPPPAPIVPAPVYQLAPPTPAVTPPLATGTRTCPRCRGASDDLAQFCRFCGATLAPDAPPPKSERHASEAARAAVKDPPVAALGRPAVPLGFPSPAPSLPVMVAAAPPAPVASPGLAVATVNDAAPPVAQPSAPSYGRVVIITKEGAEGASYPLRDQIDIGRTEGDVILADDRYLSPRHARISRRAEPGKPVELILTDLRSTNGIYSRLGREGSREVTLEDQDLFLVGQQVLRFETVRDAEEGLAPAVQHGTLVFGTPTGPRYARLSQRTVEGVTRDVFHVQKAETVLGRESGDIVFTDDPFLSRRHAAIKFDQEKRRFVLSDLGSSNGTFVRIRGQVTIKSGDQFRIGQQLFRVDLSAAPAP